MRILTVSNLYPPIVEGGYEARCAVTVESLRREHEVLVLTSARGRDRCPADATVLRELPVLPRGMRSILRAPRASATAMQVMRTAMEDFGPDLVMIWNGTGIPQAALRVAELSGIPLAYVVGEQWLGRIYKSDPFVRCLLPGEHGLHALWGRVARASTIYLHFRLMLSRPRRRRSAGTATRHAEPAGSRIRSSPPSRRRSIQAYRSPSAGPAWSAAPQSSPRSRSSGGWSGRRARTWHTGRWPSPRASHAVHKHGSCWPGLASPRCERSWTLLPPSWGSRSRWNCSASSTRQAWGGSWSDRTPWSYRRPGGTLWPCAARGRAGTGARGGVAQRRNARGAPGSRRKRSSSRSRIPLHAQKHWPKPSTIRPAPRPESGPHTAEPRISRSTATQRKWGSLWQMPTPPLAP